MPNSCPILPPDAASLQRCADWLRSGEVLGVPTETVYGLAGNALCESTVRKIFEVKGRPFIDPLIVHFRSIEEAAAHVELNDRARELAAQFWPGALTLVLPKKPSIPDIVTAGLPSVAVRVPAHPVLRALLEKIDFPLAAPSANPFGYVSPTLAVHVQSTLGRRIPAVLDGGPCEHGLESTIIDLRDPEKPTLLRPGPISAESLGIASPSDRHCNDDTKAQAAPGMLTQHYSPHAKITLFEAGTSPKLSKDVETPAIIYARKPVDEDLTAHTFWLSESGDLAECAHNLFGLIQKLDQQSYSQLYVEKALHQGIGLAINDRLQRAAAKQ